MNAFLTIPVFARIALFAGALAAPGLAPAADTRPSAPPMGTQQQGAGSLHLTLWAEYPAYGGAVGSLSSYFSRLRDLIATRQINRLIFRAQDPGSFDIYQIAGTPGGDSGLFLTALLLDPGFIATGCEVYVLPWLDPANPWGYPKPAHTASYIDEATWNPLNNVQKSVLWIQLVNEYVYGVNPDGRMISGLIYEQEGAKAWNDKTKALPAFRAAMSAHLRSPTPAYRNAKRSAFKLASASQFDFDTAGTGVYLHEIYPQMYNLTLSVNTGAKTLTYVDATSDAGLLNNPDTIPAFPNTLYTACRGTPVSAMPDFACLLDGDGRSDPGTGLPLKGFRDFKAPPTSASLAGRLGDVHWMFSSELAPQTVAGIPNTFHDRDTTMTGATEVGTINAFGVDGYSWPHFLSFLKFFSRNFTPQRSGYPGGFRFRNFAVFQTNMLPPDWLATEYRSRLGDGATQPVDTDTFTFSGRKGECVSLAATATHGRGRVAITLRSDGYSENVTGRLPQSLRAELPANTEYRVDISNAMATGAGYAGEYLLGMSSSRRAWKTLKPTASVE